MSLFDTDEDTGTATAPELASPKQVRLLEGFNYRREAVRLWTREKAETVLRDCQREDRFQKRRAEGVARQQDGHRGQPSLIERASAADYVTQAQGDGIDELLQAVKYSLYVCTDDEIRRLAGYLVKLWKPAAGEPE